MLPFFFCHMHAMAASLCFWAYFYLICGVWRKSQGENVSPDVITYNSATWQALYGTFVHLDRLVYVGMMDVVPVSSPVECPCYIPFNSDAAINNQESHLYLSHLNHRREKSWDLDLLTLESDAGDIKSPVHQVGFGFSQVITSCGRGRCLHVLTFLPELRCQRLVSAIHPTWHIAHLCWLHMWHRYTLINWFYIAIIIESLPTCILLILPFLKDWHLERRRLTPNRVTFNSLLSACDGAGHSARPYPSRQAPHNWKTPASQ